MGDATILQIFSEIIKLSPEAAGWAYREFKSWSEANPDASTSQAKNKAYEIVYKAGWL
jgi:hypothetical protein